MANRRGNHEGSITQRADGRWQAMVYVNGERRFFYARTREEAAGRLTDALKAERDNAPLPKDALTVKAHVESWLKSAKHTLRPSTYAGYSTIVEKHIVPALGHHKLVRLEPRHVRELLAEKLDAGKSPRRVQMIRAVLRVALHQAERDGLVVRNVAALVQSPKVVHHEIAPLTPEHARRLLAVANTERLGALFVVALATGCRQGELLGLTWDSVDLDAGVLHVRRALQRIGGVFSLVEPKTARSRRTLPLPAVAVDALKGWRVRQVEERLRLGEHWRDTFGLVFTAADGAPLHAATVTHTFQSFMDGHNLPVVRFHDLRHSTATLMLATGANLRVVMEQLGHSQISLTANTYSHILPEALREQAGRMDTLLTGTRN